MQNLNFDELEILFKFLPGIWLLAMLSGCSNAPATKTESVFFSEPMVQILRTNLAQNPWAQANIQQCLASVQPWREKSDDELWDAMFGATIKRSWMVWSNGFCPACQKNVPMYEWKIDGLNRPWKVTCPHCQEIFPKNDFEKFYRSGRDAHGVFAPERADRSLLFSNEHPNANDPLHNFGVDDGTGYFDGTNRWYFIGAYLIYGQWKQFVMNGVRNLAAAYVLTGDPIYAHKAAILLDRVADLYPTFDYLTQGLAYEQANPITGAGKVSVWHDACRESRELALAYDMIFPAIQADAELVKFLSAKAQKFNLANRKRNFLEIQKNIEDGILRNVLQDSAKIAANFPNTEVTLIINQAILGWPENRDKLVAEMQTMLEKAAAVDGLSGEKGLGAYSALVPRTVANVLSLFDRLSPDLLPTLVARVPDLKQMFRFHVDTWFLENYYPKIGDTGAFAKKDPEYTGVTFSQNPLNLGQADFSFVSAYSLFWKLFEITQDPTYVQLLYRANGNSVANLPYDLFEAHPAQMQTAVAAVIQEHGTSLPAESVNKEKWCLGILRSGAGKTGRGVWLDYDIGGNHGHADGMNIGLYAKGLELLSGFGYPAVQFGGWFSPRAKWYKMTAAHNTVVVDGKNQMPHVGEPETEPLEVQLNPVKGIVRGKTTAWAPGNKVKLIRAAGPELVQTTEMRQYERSLLLVDLSADDSYLLDIFRVAGGTDHAKFLHGYFGTVTATGLNLNPVADFGNNTQMRNFRGGTSQPGWQADFQIDDRYHYLADGAAVHLQYTDLTRHAQAALAESWLVYRNDVNEGIEAWIPALMVRRQAAEKPLASTFVALLEPFAGNSNIKSITRLTLQNATGAEVSDAQVAVAVALENGKSDLLVAADAENPEFASNKILVQPDWLFETDAEFSFVRKGKSGEIEHIFLAQGKYLKFGQVQIRLKQVSALFEVAIKNGKLEILHGSGSDILEINLGN
jgi:hypothetical protein